MNEQQPKSALDVIVDALIEMGVDPMKPFVVELGKDAEDLH